MRHLNGRWNDAHVFDIDADIGHVTDVISVRIVSVELGGLDDGDGGRFVRVFGDGQLGGILFGVLLGWTENVVGSGNGKNEELLTQIGWNFRISTENVNDFIFLCTDPHLDWYF